MDVLQEGRLALLDGRPVGFVLASALHGWPSVTQNGEGWIDAIAVATHAKHNGLGARLIGWAEEWLRGQGCVRARVGGGLRPFVPGVPTAFDEGGFWLSLGYMSTKTVHDLATDLAGYATPASVHEVAGAVRPAASDQAQLLLTFLQREFPGRWAYEAEQLLAGGSRLADFMLLWTEQGVEGCCLLTFQDSVQPIERYYPYGLPKPWGQAGMVGVSAGLRGRGYGMALVDAALRRLHNNGINGCVVDWTDLVDFYARFGLSDLALLLVHGEESPGLSSVRNC